MTNHPAMTSSLHNMFSLVTLALVASTSWGQVVWTEPAFPTQNDVVTLYYDVAAGNAALVDEEPPCPPCPFVYAHTGVITSESDSPLLAWLPLLPLGQGLCTYCQSDGESLSEVMTPVWA